MPKAEKAGFPTAWTRFGQGPRCALMIHCALADSGAWGRLAGHLSGALSMLAFDQPGHGRSAPWDGRGEIQALTTAIAARFVRDDFGAGPAIVIGHSFGATVALRLAVEHPELVSRLVLIEPVFFALAFADRPELRASHEAMMAPFAEALADGDLERAARAFVRVWGDGSPWVQLPLPQRMRLARQIHLIEAAAPALNDDVGALLAPGRLDAVQAPALLLEGSASPPIIGAIAQGLVARLPSTERAVIAGAGHMVPITHAPQVAAEILRFLRSFG